MFNHRPLFFAHVSKTAGTSFVRQIVDGIGVGRVYTENGMLSRSFSEEVVDRLTEHDFIYGHLELGAALPLIDHCSAITVLRDPSEQTISNYLHICREPDSPFFAAAKELGLSEFLKHFPYYVSFQTSSLALAVAPEPVSSTGCHIESRAELAWAFLNSMTIVGTVERFDHFMENVSVLRGWHVVPRAMQLNKTEVSSADRARLRDEYASLRHRSDLSPRIALEYATYEKAILNESRSRQKLILAGVLAAGRASDPHVAQRDRSAQLMVGECSRIEILNAGVKAWWSPLHGPLRLYARTAASGVHWLSFQIRSWHFVDPDQIQVWQRDALIPHEFSRDQDGVGYLTCAVSTVADVFAQIDIQVLRIQVPTSTPFFPCISMTQARLSSQP